MNGVVLVGFMGTGKSAVGQALSRLLHLPLRDTDEEIVRRTGKPITRIFASDGEEAFRRLESEVLRDWSARPEPAVTATGGGIVLAEDNWPRLRALGRVVLLTAEPDTILARVGEARDRPLLAGTRDEVRARIADLLDRRRARYAQADWTCATDALTPEAIAGRIQRWLTT